MGFRLFGLTGGIACGKTTVAGFLRAGGLTVIDADQVARDVVALGTEGLEAIVAEFGPGVLDDDGMLHRQRLGTIVFGDAAKRKRLEEITHPRIRQRTLELARELEASGHELAAYEAALLVENHLVEQFRPLVVVAVQPAIQLQRLMARDGISERQARARLASQMPIDEKVRVADYVIDTSCTMEEVGERTREVLASIRTSAPTRRA